MTCRDKRRKLDPSEYTFADLVSSQRLKRPGELNGQQFIIRNCINSKIYLLDHVSTMTIDDCNDCIFVTGPVSGSIFLRDSKNCTLMCASSQLRLRDCQNIYLYTACESDPIIEASTDVIIGPYFLSYKGIKDHFTSAKLSNFKATRWAQIYDFTPNDVTPNWGRYDREKQDPHKFICPPMPICEFEDLEISLEASKSFVPVTRYTDEEDLLHRQRRHEIIFDLQQDDDFKTVMTYYREKFTTPNDLNTDRIRGGPRHFLGNVEMRGTQVIFIYYDEEDESVK
ncbi:Protein XRP2 [Orchesella cincta]|uniref:Protein XRP2 n=1 Tax=Orchesella cincta TaxID=48709 RepID=A0A1D2N3Q4_ORCCI|nr:Protein XRP2 [Orchesella cincta]